MNVVVGVTFWPATFTSSCITTPVNGEVSVAPRLPNAYLEVRYEDMVNDLESIARRALDFLGVRWDERVLRFNEHARKKLVRSPTYQDVTQPVSTGAVGRWRNYQKHIEPYAEQLTQFMTAFGYG